MASGKWEQKAKTLRKEWKWHRDVVTHPLSESQWNMGLFSMKKWESEKHKSLGMPAEGFKGHVATYWLFARKDWQVESMCLGGGAVGL